MQKMKKELDYFTIEECYGGNQDWFTNLVMHMGGCAAATACDSCIYFGLKNEKMRLLYPFDIDHLTKNDYKAFSQIMKPYLKPRSGGVRKLCWFVEGLGRYIQDVNAEKHANIQIGLEEFSGEHTWQEAATFIKNQIDQDIPVPYLLLRHQNEAYKDYIWHWFLLTGYEEKDGQMYVKTATYGESDLFLLEDIWNTGCAEKGGLIRFVPDHFLPCGEMLTPPEIQAKI